MKGVGYMLAVLFALFAAWLHYVRAVPWAEAIFYVGLIGMWGACIAGWIVLVAILAKPRRQ